MLFLPMALVAIGLSLRVLPKVLTKSAGTADGGSSDMKWLRWTKCSGAGAEGQ